MTSNFVKIAFISVLKVGLSPSKKFAAMNALKADENCFLFHLKSSFRSQDI